MTDSTQKVILVAGATGIQGGAVIRSLLGKGWKLRTFNRDPAKEAAQQLAQQGVEIVQADLNDPASLRKAVEGVYGVFSIQTPREGVETETEQGKALADAAQAAGVKHFVYSSVGGAERESGIPHFESKWKVEQHLDNTDLTTTVFRPVFFMDNFTSFIRPQKQGNELILTMAMKPDVRLQMIASDDIGALVALAFENPDEYAGKAIEIAGDEITGPEIAETFSRVLGQPVRFVEQPIEQVRQFDEETATMFEWFNEHGYEADIAAVGQLYPALQTFEEYVKAHKDVWLKQ